MILTARLVLTMDGPPIENGAVLIAGNEIAAVGPASDLAQGDTVMVVGEDGKVSPRPIKIGSAKGNQWVVLDGLKAGEQVIVDGFQKMMVPGAPVKPVPWKAGASAPAAAASAPASGPASAAASAPAAAPSAAASK